jgi:hypothetical protein
MFSRQIVLKAATVACMGVLAMTTPSQAAGSETCRNTDSCADSCTTQAIETYCALLAPEGCESTGGLCGTEPGEGDCGGSAFRLICSSSPI